MILIHEIKPSVVLDVAVIFETGESLNLIAQEKEVMDQFKTSVETLGREQQQCTLHVG